ncbi:MAG TPA: hypothetical protein VHL11_01515 [Phototrophicaceae bacterium]|jgi:uncharacterized protein YdhG (YjbR/CyaY superfamily)|nr:hypothetical protein [Phototrophicaceae bacterium]
MNQPAKKEATKSAKKDKGFSSEERAAMKERARETKAAASQAEDENAVIAKIAEMEEPDRMMADRIHALIKANAPELAPKTWYGQPAYANKDGKIVCFFQPSQKFGTRYSTLGFNDAATLDDGVMWPVAFALKDLTAAEEAKIIALVKKAIG